MSDTSDLEKLYKAYEEITSAFGSIDNLLEAFGLNNMPVAQRYGIMFGFLVFCSTVTAVVTLLIVGGSFKRIAEQSNSEHTTIPNAHMVRAERAFLLERLLDARQRMMNYYPIQTSASLTNLTKMLMCEHPKDRPGAAHAAGDEKKEAEAKYDFPEGYEDNYRSAYNKCQDAPGGATLSGRPEARFEAYARGFAACGNFTALWYRVSYARMYEALSCVSHKSDAKFEALFKTRPQDIIGKYLRLEPLQVDRHLANLFKLTSGVATFERKAFDPEEIWSFLESGPFANENEMHESFVFQRVSNEAAFALVDQVTESLLGCVILKNDDPRNLSIQLEPPIMTPDKEGSQIQIEACFLLMDKLFALGYRRIQMSIDAQDIKQHKLAQRLGFTLEGVLSKHMILKEASRDSNIYGMRNNDWDSGARFSLFKKLHGNNAALADHNNRKKEEEQAEQSRQLAEKKALEMMLEEQDKKQKKA